jgi:hypothetical protein
MLLSTTKPMIAIMTAATQANKNALMMTDFLFFRQLHFFIRFLFLAGLTGQLVSTITK